MTLKLILGFDGGITRNPGGQMTYGVVISDSSTKEILHVACGVVCSPVTDKQTNNVAEWHGLFVGCMALPFFADVEEIIIRGDSQLVLRQLTGEYSITQKHLLVYRDMCHKILHIYDGLWTTHHVHRERNEYADALANKAKNLGHLHEKNGH